MIFAVLSLQLGVEELIIKIGNVKMVNLKRVKLDSKCLDWKLRLHFCNQRRNLKKYHVNLFFMWRYKHDTTVWINHLAIGMMMRKVNNHPFGSDVVEQKWDVQ